MKSLIAVGCIAGSLLAAAPSQAQVDIGSGLVGAGVGAAIGGIAGGGLGAATGAIVGGSVGALSGAFRPGPAYAYPYRRHAGCHWIPAHHNRYGEWRPGHCRY
jgi:L-aminopeptidase/D-esterase-like protein